MSGVRKKLVEGLGPVEETGGGRSGEAGCCRRRVEMGGRRGTVPRVLLMVG